MAHGCQFSETLITPARISFGEAWLGFGDMIGKIEGSFGKDLKVQRQTRLGESAF